MRTEIRLSPTAVKQMEEILTSGKGLEARILNGRLVIWETQSKKKYDVVIAERR